MQTVIDFIRTIFATDRFIPLHEPRFLGNEKKYLLDCIDSTFVSSVGKYVNRFEQEFAQYIGSRFAIATVNGTSALHIALLLAGVEQDDEVITQPLTFIATCNAISYQKAHPVFIDVDKDTMGLSPTALLVFLTEHAKKRSGVCVNKTTGRIIKACVPMHTFGHPCRVDEIKTICDDWGIFLVEDSAESLGSYYKGNHTGRFGQLGAFSFNGNKVITSGGGGVIVTDDENLAKRAKHLTTTAKIPHPYEFMHDEIGYNYRMPNLNAALLVAQLEQLDRFLVSKRELASIYRDFFIDIENISFVNEPENAQSNYWLQTILLNNERQQKKFLQKANVNNVMTRPAWQLMNELAMFKGCFAENIENAKFLKKRLVNIPSSVRV